MSFRLDENGQPPPDINFHYRWNRDMNELLGFIRGLVADRTINPAEVTALERFLERNRDLVSCWPANVLSQRLQRIYADGVVTDGECNELHIFLEEILGGGGSEDKPQATDLPLCRPVPEVIFDQNVFVLTGRFIFGPRKACEQEIEIRGGQCKDTVTLQTQYLVVGSIGSRDWKTSAWGNKILRAVELKKSGSIHIVSEETWASYLMGV